MLKEIFVDGYKCIDQEGMELKPFTLLSGVNSAGKTSMLRAVEFVLDFQRQYIGSRERDSYGVIGRFADVFNSVKRSHKLVFKLTEENSKGDKLVTKLECSSIEDINMVRTEFPEREKLESHIILRKVVHLSADRIGVQNTYDLNIPKPWEIGDRAQYVYSYLDCYGAEELPETNFIYEPHENGVTLYEQVNYWLEYIMGFRIRVNTVPDVERTIVIYSNAKSNRYYRASNVGAGVTYVSTFVIAALSRNAGDTLIVENPEIHLHPRAQSRLMEFMAFLCNGGLQILAETYSSNIYKGMRKCIKRQKLDKDKVAVYYFELDESLQTKLHRITFNDKGAEEIHPYGMFDDSAEEVMEM